MPLLIVLITLGVESSKPVDGEAGFDTSYPNIGQYRCFLGNMRVEGTSRPYYVTTAHFLYFQLEVLILLFTSVILIGLSFLHIHEPVRNKIKCLKALETNATESEKKANLEEFKKCLSFFFVAGYYRH